MVALYCRNCASDVEFEETTLCKSCTGVDVLSEEAALSWTLKTRSDLRSSLKRIVRGRPEGFEQRCAAKLDGWVVVREGDQIAVNHIAWGAAEALSEAYCPPTEREDVAIDAAVDLALTLCRDVAVLNELEHLLRQGTRALVRIPDTKRDDPQFHPACLTAPEYAAWNRRSHSWTRWTQVGLHAGPDSTRDEATFARALVGSDIRASIYANLMHFGLPVAPINTLSEVQSFKRYANRIPSALQGLDRDAAEHLRYALYDLVGPEGHVPYEKHVTGRPSQLELDADAPQATMDLVNQLRFGSSAPIAPVFLPTSDNSYWFSTEMIQGLQRLATNYAQLPNGQLMTKYAGDCFEDLVSELLQSLGCTTRCEGVRLTGVYPTRESEVDVFAWSEDRVFLIEAKCEMENPGAWAADSRQDRMDEVEKYRRKLEEKSAVWENVLSSSKPTIYYGQRQPIKLPRGLLDRRTLSPAIISVRVESRPPEGQVPVYTYMPPLAAEVARRRLAPTERFAPFWMGEDLP